MSLIIVDVESDGPIPGDYSMVSFGAVVINGNNPASSFYGKVKPISDKWVPEALAISAITREQHLTYYESEPVMRSFAEWIKQVSIGRPVFVSDNLAYDWQFINWYFHHFTGSNPFGFSGRRIGDIYSGLECDLFKASEWKKFRVTKHTHNPVDDATGNKEALLTIAKKFNLKLPK